ncbi:meiosis regulator and mRNA stability factor 1-like [Haliotis cracherodii]|uniref:meiosis regulator and mRNA stability factor 1-like n=1 Tax=Haliotis cracherodii TaxID=6455 RepID=UPI0039EA89FE
MGEDSPAIGVFWDIENCPVPKWKSALSVVQRIRDRFFHGHREAEFMCVCDILKERKDIIEELNSAQVDIIHISASSKNAADDKIKQSLRRFADTHPPHTKVILISGDVNFSMDLSDLRHRKNFHVILIHRAHSHPSLIACANEHFCFEELVEDVPCRSPSKTFEGLSEVEVRGFPSHMHTDKLRARLKKLSENCGGRVTSITQDYALLKFSSHEVALRAQKRMDGEDVFGQKIIAQIPATSNTGDSTVGSPHTGYTKRSKLSMPGFGSPKHYNRHSSPSGDRRTFRNNSPYRGCVSAPVASGYTSSPEANNRPSDVDADKQPDNYSTNGKRPSREMLMLQQQRYQESQHKLNGGCGGGGDAGDEMDGTGELDNHRYAQRVGHWSGDEKGKIQSYKRRHFSGSHSDEQTENYHYYSALSHNSSFTYGSGSPIHNPQRVRHGSGPFGCRPKSVPYELDHPYGSSFPPPQDNEFFHRGSPNFRSYSPRRYNCMNSNQNNCNYQQNNYHNNFHNNINSSNSFQPIMPGASPPGSPLTDGSSPQGMGPVELVVTNLDYNISAKEWRKILFTTFHPHVKVLNVHVKTQLDNTCIGMIKVPTIEEARFAISQFHRKKIGYKRIQVSLKTDDAHTASANIRAEAIALLQEAKGNVLPLFKFIELFDKRYHRSISVSELYKMRDTLDIREQGGAGRMVYLAPVLAKPPTPLEASDTEGEEVLEEPVCASHCPEGSVFYAEAMNSSMLPNVRIQLKTLAAQVHSMLQSHNGHMPLMSFPACYAAEFSALVSVKEGVPLEHLISCVPGIQVQVSRLGVKKVQWMENQPPQAIEFGRQSATASPLLSHQLGQISREVTDLLKHSANCRMPVSKFIPAYHHHFGRQCRVADYGYTKLMELFEAIPYALQVLGTGDRKILTLSHRAQIRRFTADLLKVLKGQPAKQLAVEEFPEAFEAVFGKAWDVTEYGVCYIEDLLMEIPPSTLLMTVEEGKSFISVPKRDQTSEEMERTKQFALEVVDLLKHNPRCRMPFNKFIPAYHHHFGRQCRVADYGFTKLTDLFEAVPQVVELEEEGDERLLRLTQPEMRKVLSEQITNLLKIQPGHGMVKDELLPAFTRQFSFNLHLQDFQVVSLDALLARLRHIISIETYNNVEYVVLMKTTELPPLALRVLQLLMDQSSGCLPLVELCSWYKTTFSEECDVQTIKEELVDFVHVSGDDDGSAVIRLTALQTLARDIRHMLMRHGRIPLHQFDKIFFEVHGVEMKPALHGFDCTHTLLQAIPHVVSVRGKGNRKYVQLSPAIKVPATLPASLKASPARIFFSGDHKALNAGKGESSNDSGVNDALDEELDRSHVDVLSQPVPSAIPSPELRPALHHAKDLIQLDSPQDQDILFLTDEEKRGQKTPLCLTPTSELLQFAAQCLVIRPPEGAGSSRSTSPAGDSQQGLARNSALTLAVTATEFGDHDPSSSNELLELLKGGWWKASPEQLEEVSRTFRVTASGRESPADPALRSHGHTPSIEPAEKLPNGEESKPNVSLATSVPMEVPASEGGSINTTLKDASSSFSSDESSEQNVAHDVSFDEMFKMSMPLETSSTKSSTGSTTDTPVSSPRKSRSRMAARFVNPIHNDSA